MKPAHDPSLLLADAERPFDQNSVDLLKRILAREEEHVAQLRKQIAIAEARLRAGEN